MFNVKSLLFRLAVILPAALTAACIPLLVHDTFEPEMAGATIKSSNCLDTKRVEYGTHGIVFSASAYKDQKESVQLTLGYSIPAGITATLVDPAVHVASPSIVFPKRHDILALRPAGPHGAPAQQLGPMVGEGSLADPQRPARFYALDVSLDLAKAEDFRAIPPALRVNGATVNLPVIQFKRQTQLQVMQPINC